MTVKQLIARLQKIEDQEALVVLRIGEGEEEKLIDVGVIPPSPHLGAWVILMDRKDEE